MQSPARWHPECPSHPHPHPHGFADSTTPPHLVGLHAHTYITSPFTLAVPQNPSENPALSISLTHFLSFWSDVIVYIINSQPTTSCVAHLQVNMSSFARTNFVKNLFLTPLWWYNIMWFCLKKNEGLYAMHFSETAFFYVIDNFLHGPM